jgi:hypothetical protein
MNPKTMKKLRKLSRKNDSLMVDQFRVFLCQLPFLKRVKLCWKILWRTF